MQTGIGTSENVIALFVHLGNDSDEYFFSWDNHSPSWADSNTIKNGASFIKSKTYKYRTNTAEGTSIQGDVYICNKVSIGNISFFNVPFYKISHQTNKHGYYQLNGVLGEELIDKGIWKLDFRKSMITFTSSIDSLKELAQAYLLPSKFKNNIIVSTSNFS